MIVNSQCNNSTFFFLPSISLQGKAIQSPREDGGPMLLEKAARQFASQGEKGYNFGKYNCN